MRALRRSRGPIPLMVIACAAILPLGKAEAQDVDAVHLVVPYLVLGFGGEADTNVPFGNDLDLDPTVGFGSRLEVPVHDYLTVGGLFHFNSFKLDLADERSEVFDFSGFVKGRYVLDAGEVPLELYVGMPLGLSVVVFDESLANTDTGFGWNIGLLFGAMVFVHERVGFMAELGFMHHSVSADVRGGGGDLEADANQARLHLGAVFLL